MSSARKKAVCASCGAAVRARDRFCPACGSPIAAAQGPSLPPSAGGAAASSASLQVGALEASALAEQRKVVTILFADLSGSTPLGEKLDPEDLRGILAAYFNQLARQIRRYEGTIDKYIGDAVMAVFGAPLSHEDDAERAIRAALAMQLSIQTLNDDLERQHGVRLALRIGINTGEVVAGMLGGDVQSAYTVVGDAVNTAQRFESVAPLNQILVSETTRRLAIHSFEFETLPPVTLKGKAEPVAAYRVIGRRRDEEIEPDASPLIGREEQLSRLQAALTDAIARRGRILHLHGDAGVGKSRLLAEFRARLPAEVDRMVARCASFETLTPYALIAALIRAAFRIQPTDDEATTSVAIGEGFKRFGVARDESAVALILDVLGFSDRSSMDPEQKRRLLLVLLRGFLRGAGQRTPFVITAEDLQWCDAASAAILVELVRDVTQLPGLFITTARPGWSTPWEAEPFEIPPLDEAEAHALVEEIYEGGPGQTTVRAVLERTGGNPFFIEEVVRELKRGASTLPATVQEVLEARLDRLGEAPGRVIRDAAVIGATFWYRLLERVELGHPLAPHLLTLEQEAFVVIRAMTPELTYAFRQALIREVAYQTQLLVRRRGIHGAVGRAIEELYGDRIDEFVDMLAHHYERGDDPVKALFWLTRAGDRARSLFANEEALTLYAAALARAGDGDGELSAGTILERIADIQRLIGRYDASLESLRSAEKRIPEARPETVARLRRKAALAWTARGAYAEALAALDEATAVLGATETVEGAWVAATAGEVNVRRGDYPAARETLQRAVRLAERLGADDVLASALKHLGNAANNVGDLRGAIELYTRSLAAYERLGDQVGLGDLHSNVGNILRRMGRLDETLREYETSLAIRRRIGHVWGVGVTLNNVGEMHRYRGEPASALPSYAEAIAIFQAISAANEANIVLMNQGAAKVEAGDIAGGRADLMAARDRFEAKKSGSLPSVYRDLASAELAAGDLDAATAAADHALDLARAAKARHSIAMIERIRAQIAFRRSDRDTAFRLLDESAATFEELGEGVELARTKAVRARLLG
jgi:class 3 adenylate cyclase/tetratricopeptide (TPR) repeat protein